MIMVGGILVSIKLVVEEVRLGGRGVDLFYLCSRIYRKGVGCGGFGRELVF